jgi:hypothetical protein
MRSKCNSWFTPHSSGYIKTRLQGEQELCVKRLSCELMWRMMAVLTVVLAREIWRNFLSFRLDNICWWTCFGAVVWARWNTKYLRIDFHPGMVVHTCKSISSRGRNRKDHSLKTAQAKSLWDSILTYCWTWTWWCVLVIPAMQEA